jgi:transposase
MIRPGFLDSESRSDLIELARHGSAEHRLARRANALVLLDNGRSSQAIAEVLLLDNDTIRLWYQLYQDDGIEGLTSFGHEGGTCRLTVTQQDKLKAWIAETLPRTTRAVGAWIAAECRIEYQTRSGLIALLHRLGMEHCKPKAISRELDPVKHASFIKAYHALERIPGMLQRILRERRSWHKLQRTTVARTVRCGGEVPLRYARRTCAGMP